MSYLTDESDLAWERYEGDPSAWPDAPPGEVTSYEILREAVEAIVAEKASHDDRFHGCAVCALKRRLERALYLAAGGGK